MVYINSKGKTVNIEKFHASTLKAYDKYVPNDGERDPQVLSKMEIVTNAVRVTKGLGKASVLSAYMAFVKHVVNKSAKSNIAWLFTTTGAAIIAMHAMGSIDADLNEARDDLYRHLCEKKVGDISEEATEEVLTDAGEAG